MERSGSWKILSHHGLVWFMVQDRSRPVPTDSSELGTKKQYSVFREGCQLQSRECPRLLESCEAKILPYFYEI
jgi:hypothetical protein